MSNANINLYTSLKDILTNRLGYLDPSTTPEQENERIAIQVRHLISEVEDKALRLKVHEMFS